MVTNYEPAGVSVNLRFRCVGYWLHVSGQNVLFVTVTYSAHLLGLEEVSCEDAARAENANSSLRQRLRSGGSANALVDPTEGAQRFLRQIGCF